jgi:hypothetical protein
MSIFGRVLGTLPGAGQGGQLRRLWKPGLLPALVGQPNRSGGGLYGAEPGEVARLQNTAAHLLTETRLEWAVVDNRSPGAVTSIPFPPKEQFERKESACRERRRGLSLVAPVFVRAEALDVHWTSDPAVVSLGLQAEIRLKAGHAFAKHVMRVRAGACFRHLVCAQRTHRTCYACR